MSAAAVTGKTIDITGDSATVDNKGVNNNGKTTVV